MDPSVVECLRQGRISDKRLGELGLGTVGITLNPHFILDRQGCRTPWLAKRLRARMYPDPAATFERFQREHALVVRFFGAEPAEGAMIPETAFLVLDRNLDDHPDYERNREYVMVQAFVEGVSLQQAAESYRGAAWLRNAASSFVQAYQRMQREGHAVLDCFSVRSDHVKVDTRRKRFFLIDTNNPVVLREEVAQNHVFCERFRGDPGRADANDVHDVFEALCASGQYDPDELACSQDREFLREACALEHLARYFPRDGGPNKYLREVIALFGMPA